MSREEHDRPGTADLAARADRREMPAERTERPAETSGMAPIQDAAQRPDQQPPAGMQPQERAAMAQQAQAADPTHADPAAARHPQAAPATAEQLAALFPPEVAADFRGRWDQVQIGFVDDPRRAVQQADELVAEVMKSLAASFADQRARLEAGLARDSQAGTEDLRMALRGYRSFFQRLLSL